MVIARHWSSAVYEGWVRHRRHAPKAHAFRYRIGLLYLDLGEIDALFADHRLWSVDRRNLAEFRRSDYLGDPALPLDRCVRDRAEAATGQRPGGPIRLLAHLRYGGHCFNPVAFYYCYADDGSTLQCIVAEITNTPWRERHVYVLPIDASIRHGRMHEWQFDKAFHVSPFMAMRHRYAWRLDEPGERLDVHMSVLDADTPTLRTFDATLVLRRQPISGASLARVLWRYPLMTLQVVFAIHWQALRLWLRGNPVHDHPDHKATTR